jgi:Fe-S cluster assembly protein SufD
MPATIGIREYQESYLASFAARERAAAESIPWLRMLRSDAIGKFAELGFPTTRNEEWKYTNTVPFLRNPYELAGPAPADTVKELLADAPFAALDPARAVIVNGLYSPELSTAGDFPEGVIVTSLAEALSRRPEVAERHLAKYAGYEDNAFVALNTAFAADGALIEIPNGAVVERPIVLLFVSSGGGRTVAHPRTLVLAGRDSQAAIVEVYIGRNESEYFTNAVTEMVAGEGAVIEHYKLQREADRAFHFGALQVQQARSSSVVSHNVTLGGALARNEISAVLNGEGAECALNGLFLATVTQHVDNYTTMDHAMPRCNSHELYKGILDGAAQGVFHGRIIVRKDAQKTDAIQRNRNLLLSEKAVINTKPQLEIYADDVKCTHGATIGQVDADAVFYLRSRGIAREDARNLLTYAFANEMLERMKLEAVRSELAEALFARLARHGTREAL